MKEDIPIDQLFQKAAKSPVHTSFDETKEQFKASLVHKTARKWKNLRFKNWIIMIAIISAAALSAVLLLGSNTEPSAKNENAGDEKAHTIKTKPSTHQVVNETGTGPSEEQLKVVGANFKDGFIPMEPLEQIGIRNGRFSQRLQLKPMKSKSHIYDLASDRRERKDSVEIPTLSEDEIAENHKMKKRMLKALAKRDKSNYIYIPSGSSSYKGKVFSVQAFYMQVNEVTNAQYRTFLNDLLIQDRKEEYKKAYPQEFQWSEKIEGDQSTMQKLYFTHPAYDDYPVVNVTREGAEMYCMWLTLETRKSKYISNTSSMNDVRLPQRLEWVYAASGGKSTNKYPWGGPSTQNTQKCYLANYNPDTTNMQADGAFYTAQTETYNPNDFGLYNMSGNVAEMVYGSTEITSRSDLISFKKDPGTAGGGWIDSAETLKIEGDDPYAGITEGHPNVGFRVVITYLRTNH